MHKTIDPSLAVKAAIFTSFDRAVGKGPDYGNQWGEIAHLYGYNAANLASSYLITDELLPALFHQDPRFFRKDSGSTKSKVLWALRNEVVAYSDRGTRMPNYPNLLGLGMSSAVSNAYLPSEDVSFANTMERYGLKFAVSSCFNLMREFDVLNRIRKRR